MAPVFPSRRIALSKAITALSMSPRLKASSPSLPVIWACTHSPSANCAALWNSSAASSYRPRNINTSPKPSAMPYCTARSAATRARSAMRYCCSATSSECCDRAWRAANRAYSRARSFDRPHRSDRPGRIRDPGRLFVQRKSDLPVQVAAGLARQPLEQGGTNLVVNERETHAVRLHPHKVPLAGLVQTMPRSRQRVAEQSPPPAAGRIPCPTPRRQPTDRWSAAAAIRFAAIERRPPNSTNAGSPGLAARPRQPLGSATKAPDSTIPRSIAVVMNGQPSGEPHHDVDRLIGQRPRHRLGQTPHLVGPQRVKAQIEARA